MWRRRAPEKEEGSKKRERGERSVILLVAVAEAVQAGGGR